MAFAENIASAPSSTCPQTKQSGETRHGWTPPDSPTMGSVMPQVTMEDLEHLFEVLQKVLSGLTAGDAGSERATGPTSRNCEPPNTPVFQHLSQPGPDMVQLKQLLVKVIHDGYPSIGTIEATKPAQSCFASNEQEENAQAAKVIDLESPISTTPDDFKSFENWASYASTPQFKTVVETWDKEACKYKIAEPTETSSDLGDYDEYIFVIRERVDRANYPVLLPPGARGVRALFKPGSYVFTTCFGSGEPRCVIFDAGEETTQDDVEFYKLECRFLDYDRTKFGKVGVFLRILKFRGSKPIKTLEAFPLHLYPSHQRVRKDLVGRGQKFRDLAGSHVQYCTGSAFFMKNGKPFKININSRVGVDAAFFREMQPNYSRPRLHDIWAKEKEGISVINLDTLFGNNREQEKERMQEGNVDAQQMSEDDFLICCPTVCCFSFKEKMFLECAVGALGDVQWSPESFDCLKIPSKTKTLLSSLAKTRLGLVPAVPFDDVIDGKGRGLNILLYGPPGVRKTFTVEATSERFNLPLYSISAGELVVDHGDSNALEQQLENIFKIAKHFKAVLLLDEVDAFMEQRTSYHDTYNRLVTVFLRKLEYYQGILFLTTNRMIQFDEAIMSRIYLTIKYEGLTREFRREIWKNLLSKAQTVQGPAMVGHDELQLLDNFSLNGREIKNLTSIAHALATVGEELVSYKYLEIAAESNEKLSEKFSQESRVESMYV
ncbi:ATPase AAA-type [Penicillium alfredii]|uniref:ATPase AAA-type n=1 Tax=Penicillium alfredii TaxID=1506179 RepID=A0A9W9K3F5_9EURO|nr:ATPase AAA-type [Penicillium alfredii]KAJ5091678.1 ATPase AAA-type [Penicillium alfredii]